ncbi:hypothetical protein Cfor_02210, partial [Coptotermes formosanus]
MSDSSEDLFSEELRKAVDAKNAACEKLPIGDISAGESEKENENGKESFKSPSKNRQVLAVLDETEEELKYRQKYAKTEKEVVKSLKLCCTVCSCSLQAALLKGRNLYHHPVLKVLMCKQCVDFYGDGNFSADEDGSDKYCRWCGQGGMLYCCSLCCCAFCKSCIKRNLGRSVLVDIEAEDWKCFVCNGEPLWDLRALCASARSYSEKTKRNKWVENQNDPKQMPLKDKPRQLRQWKKHSLVDSSSSDDDDDDDASSGNEEEACRSRCKQNDANTVDSGGRRKDGKKQSVKSCDPFMETEIPNSGKKIICVQLSDLGENEKKIKSGPLTDNSTSPTHFEGSSSNEGVRTHSSREKKRQGRKSEIRRTQTGKEESSIPRHAVGTAGERESKSKQKHSNGGSKELPEELDKRSAKLACQLLENCCKDLADVGEVLVLRAHRCVEKKVNLKAMRNPKNVDKVVSSLRLLMELARDNLHHIDEFLSLSRTRWIQGVVKRSSTKTGGSVDNEGKLEKSVTKQGRVDENMSMNGVGDDDMELHSHSENDSDNGKIENKETAEGQSDILCADSDNIKEMRTEKSKKRKFRKEWSGSDDNEVVNTGENEGNAEKSIIRDKKRRKLEDGLDIEIDEVVDPDTRTSENCMGDSVCEMKGSSNQTVTELGDELGEEAVKDVSTDATECGRDSEVKKVSDRNKSLSGGSEEREEDNVAKKNVEDTSSLHEPSDRLTLLETDPGDDSTVWSQAGFESVSTLQLLDEQRSIVSDILTDPEKSVVHVEETLQQKSHKKSDEGQDYEQLNAESEGKRTHPVKNDGDLATIDEDSKNGDHGDVAVNNSDSDADTIECLFSDVGEESLSDEDHNGKNEKLTSADNLSSIKKHPEENKETDGEVKINEDMPVSLEVPDNVEKDSGSTIHPYITVRNIKELLMEKYVAESNGQELCQDLEKDTGKKDEVKGRLEDDDKQRSSDIGSLKLRDSMSECEQEEKDGEEDIIEVDEDNAAAGDNMEEGAADTLKYTEECMKAQQSVLAYTTDNEDTSTDSLPEKKKRKTHARKTKQEVAALKGTKPAKKQRVGSKSEPHNGSDTVSSSLSSTDIDSECSMGRKLTKLKEGRKQKFRLRDTEAYKQDEKLQWKCTVLVERLSDEVFQKYYEEYCTDGDDGSEKKAKASSDIHSLINLKSLEKCRTNKYDTDDSDTEDSIDVGKKKSRKITKKDKNKEQEQKLINFFNQMDDDDDNMRASTSDPEEEATKTPRTKKSFCDKESEMVMKELLASSTDDTDTDSSEKQESPEENKKKEIKPKEKTDGTEAVIKKEEEKEQEIKEEKADSCPSDGDVSSDDSEVLKRKRNWRRDKLLTARLSDPDTSDEERRWKTKKEKEQKENNDDSEEKSACEMKPRKKKLRRRILGSDEDPDVIISSSEDDSSDGFVNKRKKPAKKSNSGKDSTSDTDTGRKKVKRRRIKAPADDSSSSEGGQVECSQKSDTPGKGRKNIHRIMKDADVGEATRRAGREEEERRKRMLEKQKLYNEIYKEVEGVQVFDRLVLDFDPETKEELVAVDPYIVSKLKPHQVKGVKFMWDVCFESLKQTEKTTGSGCILAHCMGLGKTLQVVALVHTLLNHKDTKVHTVLVVCPLSTVLNWVNEFNIWLKDIGDGEEVNVFELSKYKQNYERMYQLKEWQDCGGVMVMGYDMFRILTNPKAARIRKKAIETFQSTLIDPGPDLVVCDEGHMLKNEDTALSKAMNRIKTLRRIVLTGTPLQNNLKEYHCMVQFVKPNLLGTQKEFRNRFMNPISNGQFEDSTAHDVKIMKRRAHVLHKMLEGSVQRFDYSVLTPFLPPKHEYVISIRLAEVQIKAYRYYLENCAMGKSGVNSRGTQLFNDYQNLSRIWTHPRVLQMSAENAEKNAEKKRLLESDSEGSLRDFIDDGDADDTETTESSDKSSSDESDVQVIAEGGEKKSKATSRNTRSTQVVDVDEVEESKPVVWWKQFIEGDEIENIKCSGKLVLLFSILRECEKIGDKVLVFSQSLYSLDLIEYFLACVDTATQASETKESLDNNTGSWSLGLDYFRLDGSTSAENRSIWCRAFNREDNHRARLFIISTRAGGLGINLCAANRVIVFDASWNPSHDVQSIFRVYRFGQKKPCYIYRFLAQGTMEEKIYDRQVTKLSLSCRVVDEQQIERHYNMADLQELYKFNPEEKTKRPTPILPKDRLLAELLKDHEQWIVTYHEHDSLLENKEEEELNEEERKAAWEDYENEKKGKILPAPVFNAPRTLNVAALRETLRKENPHVTEEELDLRLSTVVNQIYDYVNSSKHGMPSSNVQQYTPGHIQALRQYQMQQEQFLRAQQQEQQRMQQQNVMWPMLSSYPNTDMSFRQYLQNQNQSNLNSAVYPTNLYRNVAVDRPGILRMQQKLVPFNAPGSSSRTV